MLRHDALIFVTIWQDKSSLTQAIKDEKLNVRVFRYLSWDENMVFSSQFRHHQFENSPYSLVYNWNSGKAKSSISCFKCHVRKIQKFLTKEIFWVTFVSLCWQKLGHQFGSRYIYVLTPTLSLLMDDFASENWDKPQYLDQLITPKGEYWEVSQRYF